MPKVFLLLAFTAVMALTAACTGQRVIRGEMPLIRIDSLERSEQDITFVLALRNVNDQAFEIASLSYDLLVDGSHLAGGSSDVAVVISPRGRERIPIEATAAAAGLEHLEALARGERNNLPWTMDISLRDERGRSRDAELTGWLHAVPGQPDRFR